MLTLILMIFDFYICLAQVVPKTAWVLYISLIMVQQDNQVVISDYWKAFYLKMMRS